MMKKGRQKIWWMNEFFSEKSHKKLFPG